MLREEQLERATSTTLEAQGEKAFLSIPHEDRTSTTLSLDDVGTAAIFTVRRDHVSPLPFESYTIDMGVKPSSIFPLEREIIMIDDDT